MKKELEPFLTRKKPPNKKAANWRRQFDDVTDKDYITVNAFLLMLDNGMDWMTILDKLTKNIEDPLKLAYVIKTQQLFDDYIQHIEGYQETPGVNEFLSQFDNQ
jgi:hypothetical protein